MQLFLIGYMFIEICEIFTVGGITQLPENVVLVGTLSAHDGRLLTCLGILSGSSSIDCRHVMDSVAQCHSWVSASG